MQRTFDGAYGAVIAEATLGLFAEGEIQSAVVVTLFENEPLYAFCITRARFKRRGFCRALMYESLAALHRAGYETAHLYVTDNNEPAVNLYERIQFEKV
jgi:ribosomal protein S18 acetylase RimI-like enzyme